MKKNAGNKGDNVEVFIQIQGENLRSEYNVFSVIVNREANKIPFARIFIEDGDVASQEFVATDSPELVPGNEIEIFAGDSETKASIFMGCLIFSRF